MSQRSRPGLDWRQPWAWPKGLQGVWMGLAVLSGACGLSPWWLANWQAWNDAQARAQHTAQQQQDILMHQARIAQMRQQLAQATSRLVNARHGATTGEAVTRALTDAAQTHQLQVSNLMLDPPITPALLHAASMQHVPLHLQLQGTGVAWLAWLGQWAALAPGVTVSSLHLKALPAGGVTVELKVLLPQTPEGVQQPWRLASAAGVASDALADPFSAEEWADIQQRQAQQHPSFAARLGPERKRLREPLEAFARERLRYVGWLSQDGAPQALVRVSEEASAAPKAAPSLGDMVYRVGVGGYLGQEFGRVSHVTPEQLSVRELVRDPDGAWHPRHVVLTLEETGR